MTSIKGQNVNHLTVTACPGNIPINHNSHSNYRVCNAGFKGLCLLTTGIWPTPELIWSTQ